MNVKNRVKYIVQAGTLIVVFLLLCGCAEGRAVEQADMNKAVPIAARTDDFSEEELKFIQDYNEILSTGDIPEQLELSASDPSATDFSMVFLPEESYGTDVFAFLPLQSRALTEEELIQLAGAYKKVPPETILQDACSYKEGSRGRRAVYSNRALTSREGFLLHVKLLSQYFLEEKRPAHPLSQTPSEGGPLCFQTTYSSSEKVWLYPMWEMTEEQLLQIIDEQYGKLAKEDYLPKEGQLSAGDAQERTERLLADFITEEDAEQIYLVYTSYPGKGLTPTDQWTAYVHMKNGGNDYAITFDADRGALKSWERKPSQFYTEEGYDRQPEEAVLKQKATDEQIVEAVREYLAHISTEGYALDSLLETEAFDVDGNVNGQRIAVVGFCLQEETWNVWVNTEDFAIEGLQIN